MIKHHMSVLAVQDLQESMAFYQGILGFTIREVGDDGWRIFERGGCRIMAGHCPDSIPARDLGDHSYFAYLVVDDVDDYYKEVVSKGVELIKELRSEPWGMREFGLRTNDGHRIMVGQDLES
ncbi:MAG: VOC family protein [Nitrospina sp.]|nr:VOC family protein [Nitrospina sp.]